MKPLIIGILISIATIAISILIGISPAIENPIEKITVENNTTLQLHANPIARQINGQNVEFFAYNSQIPGPTLEVAQGSKVKINFTNNLNEPTTVHWHGIRLENKYDGVPKISQAEIMPKESFEYELEFPDWGIYWYHPHVREDYQQEKGLYGAILVRPKKSLEKMKEEILFLDDILLSENNFYPFTKTGTNFAMMGRYGNKYFLNGRTDKYNIYLQANEKLRIYLINSANVRPFNFSISGTKFKVIGLDNEGIQTEFFAQSLILAPSERAIVEIQKSNPGTYAIENNNPLGANVIGTILVNQTAIESDELNLKSNNLNLTAFEQYFEKEPDFDFELTVDIPGAMPMMGMMMNHNEDGIEWEDSMFGMNRISNEKNTRWIIKDKKTGKENMNFKGLVELNQIFKIKITNSKNSLHPMQHPIHLHGAKFLVTKMNGKINKNLAWKDTILIPVGSQVEMITYFEKEGEWMLHCHIAEHLSSGMMTSIFAGNKGTKTTH